MKKDLPPRERGVFAQGAASAFLVVCGAKNFPKPLILKHSSLGGGASRAVS